MIVAGPPSVPGATLTPTGSKARYGVNYLATICSEAGVVMTEPPPDGDVRAIDADILFREGNVHVQVKCTEKRTVPSATAMSWRLDEGWTEKWSQLRDPVYFLVVRVRLVTTGSWIEYGPQNTVHMAHAIWTRIQTDQSGRSISVPLSNRFTASTLGAWRSDLLAGYGVIA